MFFKKLLFVFVLAAVMTSASAQVVVTTTPSDSVSTCVGTVINLSANATGGTGPYNYQWSPATCLNSSSISNPDFSSGVAGTTIYQVIVTDDIGAKDTVYLKVIVNALPNVTTSFNVSTICAGQCSTLNASGAVSYVWNPGGLSGNPVVVCPPVNTTYTVTGTNAAGCSGTAQKIVTVYNNPTITSSASLSTLCLGMSTTLTATGGNTYIWSNGSSSAFTTVTPNTTTTYYVTGTNASGCSNTSSVVVTVNPSPIVNVNANPSSICPGQTSTLTATGGGTYQWPYGLGSGNTVTVSPVTTTFYMVTVTLNGCTGTGSAMVQVNSISPSISGAGSVCAGSFDTLTASGGNTYNWSHGLGNANPVTVAPSTTTTYTVTATSLSGCTGTATATVTVNPAVNLSITGGGSICAGQSATLTASGATSFVWSNGAITNSIIVSPASTSSYSVTGTNGACTGSNSVTVTVDPGLAPTITVNSETICPGASATLTASGADTYSWSGGLGSVNPLIVTPAVNTTYTVTGIVSGGCSGTAVAVVLIDNISVTATPASVCTGLSSTLTASGAVSYQWSAGLGTGSTKVVTPAITTTYTVTGTTSLGCSSTATIIVMVNLNPVINIQTDMADDTLCEGMSVILSASGASSFIWSNGTNTSFNTVTPSATTTYTVTGTLAGCSSTKSIVINVGSCDYNVFKVHSFYDTNNNGIKDATENWMNAPLMPTIIPDPLSYSYETGTDIYTFYVSAGSYTITCPSPNFIQTTSPNFNFAANGSIVNYQLGFYGPTPKQDLKTWGVNVNARPGFVANFPIFYKNIGNGTMSGGIRVKLDTGFIYNGLLNLMSGDSVHYTGSDTVEIKFNNLLPNTTRYFHVKCYVKTTNILATPYRTSIVISPLSGDYNLLNNYDTIKGVYVNSSDPNDKKVVPEGNIKPTQVQSGIPLIYTVRFQNVGNFMASTVRVMDTLSDKLNPNTFELLMTSHPCTLKVTETYNTQWIFNDINLPDSTSDPEGSNGFIIYRVKPLTTLLEGDSIPNTAYIFFDFNSAVITNTAITKVEDIHVYVPSILENSKSILVYPNPFSEQTTIVLPPEAQYPCTLSMYDALGREVLKMEKITDSKITISRKGLPGGMYMIRVTDEKKNQIGQSKLVIE
ncbi:MAG: T9SS type A sorting domain-containing protein [Bacteroidota bacterium]